MKKISFISSLLIALALIISFVSVSTEALAQNIGSLRTVTTANFAFLKDLQPGDTDPDVKELQKVLNSDVDTVVSMQDIGSAGKESAFFGALTKNAVIRFQNKYKDTILTPSGLTVGNGNVGRATRTKLNLLLGVVNTYPSVGLPQNRAGGSAPSTTYVAPVTVVTSSGPSMTICQFVELMISIGAVAPGNIANARTQMNCTAPAGGTVYTPSVDLRVNGQNGPINLNGPGNVTISWNALNVTSCHNSAGAKALSGSESVPFSSSQNIGITCTGPLGTASDNVQINVGSGNSGGSSSNILEISCSANPSNISLNNSITWEADATGGNGNYTYSWVGDVSGNSRNVSRQYTVAGNKVATVIVTSGVRSAAASCSANVSTTTGNVASESLSVACIPSRSSASIGETVNWVSAVAGGGTNKTYLWSGAESITGNTSSTSKIYTATGTKVTTLVVTSGALSASNNCAVYINAAATSTSSSTDPFSNSSSTNPFINPYATSTTMVPDGTCLAYPATNEVNKPVVWNVLPRGGNGSYTYSWSGSDGLSGSNSTVNKTYTTAGSKRATVTINSNQLSASVTCNATIQAAGSASGSSSGSSGSGGSGGAGGSSGGSPEEDSPEDSSGGGSTGYYSGLVSSLVPCITQYYPYEEDYSKKQAVLVKCTGGSSIDTSITMTTDIMTMVIDPLGLLGLNGEDSPGYGDGYILIDTGAAMPGQTVMGQATMGDPVCINPPGKFLGIPMAQIGIGDSCDSGGLIDFISDPLGTIFGGGSGGDSNPFVFGGSSSSGGSSGGSSSGSSGSGSGDTDSLGWPEGQTGWEVEDNSGSSGGSDTYGSGDTPSNAQSGHTYERNSDGQWQDLGTTNNGWVD